MNCGWTLCRSKGTIDILFRSTTTSYNFDCLLFSRFSSQRFERHLSSEIPKETRMKFVSVLIRTSAVFAAIDTVVMEMEAERKPAEGVVKEGQLVVEKVEDDPAVETAEEKAEEEQKVDEEEVAKRVDPDEESSAIADWTIKVNKTPNLSLYSTLQAPSPKRSIF